MWYFFWSCVGFFFFLSDYIMLTCWFALLCCSLIKHCCRAQFTKVLHKSNWKYYYFFYEFVHLHCRIKLPTWNTLSFDTWEVKYYTHNHRPHSQTDKTHIHKHTHYPAAKPERCRLCKKMLLLFPHKESYSKQAAALRFVVMRRSCSFLELNVKICPTTPWLRAWTNSTAGTNV